MASSLEEKYQSILSHMRDHNIRITKQRKHIIRFMLESRDHPTAEDIYQAIKDKDTTMSLATIYNNLNLLVKEGIISEMKFSGVTSHFDFNDDDHNHIKCSYCGKIADVVLDNRQAIRDQFVQETGYKVTSVVIEAHGICPDCQKKEASA